MIVGFNVDTLNANKKESTPQGDLQVNYHPEITGVSKAAVSAIDGQVAKVDFSFTVEYTVAEETAAEIVLEGNVLWNGDTDEVVDSWEEDEKLPVKMNTVLMNNLYRKCISQSVGVADTLGLLPPVPTPRIED